MVFEERSLKDKLGRTIVLRNARPEDAEDLIKYLKITSAETPYLIREPEEITMTDTKERQLIQAKIDADRELMLVAFLDGKHVGNCSLMSIAPYKRYKHRCDTVAAGLAKRCCRLFSMLPNRSDTSRQSWKWRQRTRMPSICMRNWDSRSMVPSRIA